MKVVKLLEDNNALVEYEGVRKKICVQLLKEIKVGDYIIVHAGFGIQKLNEEEARRSLSLLKEIFGDGIHR